MLDYKNYRDFNTINAMILDILPKIPVDVDLIVGIPRSGLIVSTLLSEYLNKPHSDLFAFVNEIDNYKMSKGSRAPNSDVRNAKHILLVDDAMGIGAAMNSAIELIRAKISDGLKITTFVVFVEPKSISIPNLYCEVLRDQFLPWSILKRGTEDSCCDIDGVLTEDVPREFDDDGPKYIQFLKNQRPKFVPVRKIKILVTGRLEKYRKITEEWLKNHGIVYEKLVMCPCSTREERKSYGVAQMKGRLFQEVDLPLFIESDLGEAKVIKSMNPDKSVYCVKVANYI